MRTFYSITGIGGAVFVRTVTGTEPVDYQWSLRIAAVNGIVEIDIKDVAVINSLRNNAAIIECVDYNDDKLTRKGIEPEEYSEPYIFAFGKTMAALADEICKCVYAGYIPHGERTFGPVNGHSQYMFSQGMIHNESLKETKPINPEETICPDCGKNVSMALTPVPDEGIYQCKCGWEMTVPVGGVRKNGE